MKKLCCMLALAAFSCGTVLASGVAVKASTMQTDTTKKMNKKHTKTRKKMSKDTMKMHNDTMKTMHKDSMKMK